MKKLIANMLSMYFLTLGISSLWGAHIHHLDSGELKTEEFSHHSKKTVQKSQTNYASKEEHCISHCEIESILDHLLENRTFFRKSEFTTKSKQVSQPKIFHVTLINSNVFFKINFIQEYGEFDSLNLLNSLSPRAPPFV